ncbi:MAG TPA: hypothetical protein VJ205_04865 [Gammaproteobacteria bacterium]|nr:hypothetical protein [Gammaproteobacteria bacterium]
MKMRQPDRALYLLITGLLIMYMMTLTHPLRAEESQQLSQKIQYTRTSLLLGKAANERIPRRAHLVHNGGE